MMKVKNILSIVTVASATLRPIQSKNGTKVTRNDQLLSLLATRRRQIIENRFRTHIKAIVELAKNGTNTTRKYDSLPNNASALNLHLKLSDLLQNSVNTTSQEINLPNTEINVVNVSSPKNAQNNRKHAVINASQISENKTNTKNLPIIRNILFRRKMSYLNRKLPLDFDQITYDTLSLSEKTPDDLLMDAEDSLQVEESSHDKIIYYDVKNNSSKNSMNNFDDASEETKAMSLMNKTYHNEKTPEVISKDEYVIVTRKDKNENKTVTEKTTLKTNHTQITNTTVDTEKINKPPKIRQKEKPAKNNTHFMSQSLYNYFRPHEDVPEEEMQPFLHFGEKIQVTKQNTSKNPSIKPTQFTPKQEENTTQKHEEEIDENMDVSVTKPIYENKIPKIIPNQKTNVVQQYIKNRSYNVTKAAENRNFTKSERKTPVLNIPKLRNNSRNRGFRNRTIFFHQKRNGMRQTINLHPNTSIADLKPVEYVTDVNNQSNSINNTNNTDVENVVSLENTTSLSDVTRPEISRNVTTPIVGTSTERDIEKIIINKTPTHSRKTTEKMQKMTELTTTATTRKLSTTFVVPTTRILATDVVTSISIKSSVSDTTNKTIESKNLTNIDPEATVIAKLNNFTSQSFNKNLTRNYTRPVYHEIRRTGTKTIIEPNKSTEIEKQTPVFYLNKTDFIIHVPDVETTTYPEFASENIKETETTQKIETKTNQQIFDDIKINTRIKDVTEKDITNTMTSTLRSKTHEITTIKNINERINVTTESGINSRVTTEKFNKRIIPTEQTKIITTEATTKTTTTEKNRRPTTTEGKKMLNLSLTNQESASELPLATLFNVIDFKKTESPKNTTVPSRIIPGTETVISKKNEDSSSFDNIHAAYVLASLGLIPMAVIVIYVIRSVMKRKNKCFEDFEAELQDDKANIITPVARLPALVHGKKLFQNFLYYLHEIFCIKNMLCAWSCLHCIFSEKNNYFVSFNLTEDDFLN